MKNRYAKVIQEQIERARQEEKDKCWAKTCQVVDMLMLPITVELNDKCGLGKERIMRVNEALNLALSEYGKTDDKGYFIHCLKREYKRIIGVGYDDMTGVELEIEW